MVESTLTEDMTDEQFEALAASFPKRTPEEAEADL